MAGYVVGPLYIAFASVWGAFAASLPGIIAATILLIVGFIIGKIVGAAVKEVLLKANIDRHIELKREELKLSNFFSELVKWIIYLLFIQQAALSMGIMAVAAAFGALLAFLPSVVEAVIVVAVGYVLARYIEDVVFDSRVSYSGLMSKVFFFFVVYVSISIALPLVGIGGALLQNILLIIVGSVGLGFAIAMGLGLKDMFEDISDVAGRNLIRQMKKPKK
ncbi:MAG: hypothetical protein ABIG20_00820 [archaeon]